MKSQEDTIAVMVVYDPPESVRAAIDALLPQVKALVVVDNGKNEDLGFRIQDSGQQSSPNPESRIPNPSVHYIKSPKNNLAIAQNLGIAKARELGAEFVLLMDDDSLPAPEMVRHLREAYRAGMGVVAPYLQEPSGRAPHYIQAVGTGWFQRMALTQPTLNRLFYVAASGSLIPLRVIDAIGGMNEDFGIYFVDTEFCLRARKAGFDIVAVEAAKMQHRFGKVTSHFMCGKEITTTNHPPEARRKMYQNRKVLWWEYLLSDTGYVLFDVLRCWSEIARILLFEDLKISKTVAILRGLLAVRF